MGYELSARAEILSLKNNVKPQIIIEVDNFGFLYGALPIFEFWKIGNNHEIGESGLVIGGVVATQDDKAYVSFKGTTTKIRQQLEIDKGNVSSVQRMNVKLIDKNNEVTQHFSPNQLVEEPLYSQCRVFIGFARGSHPEDSIRLIDGVIDEIDMGSGFIKLGISSPEALKDTEIFQKVTTSLDGAIDSTQTTIDLVDASGLLEDQDAFTSYILVNDEIIKVGTITGNQITGCLRGQLGTTQAAHDDLDEVENVTRLQGPCIQLALKLLMSGSGVYGNTSPLSINTYGASSSIQNAIYFNSPNIQDELGLITGDIINSSGWSNGGNNFTGRTITELGQVAGVSYIVVDGANLVTESSGGSVNFQSQYDTLPDGCKMNGRQVDVIQHKALLDQFSSAYFDYDFIEIDPIEAGSFINEQIYFPSALFQIPRNGRASVNMNLPPLANAQTKRFNESNLKNPSDLMIKRSANKNYYSQVVFNYDFDIIKDKFTRTLKENANVTIKPSPSPLRINARGIRNSTENTTKIQAIQNRYLDRYKYAAESIEIEPLFGQGFTVEIGDTAIFGSPALKVSDSTQGNRNFKPRVMDVVNFQKDLKDGNIKLTLLDTAYQLNARYASVGPSSYIASGATTTEIPLVKSSYYNTAQNESSKWQDFIGLKVKIYSDDFTQSEEVTLTGFKAGFTDIAIVEELSFTPTSGYIMSMPDYDEDSELNELYKVVHAYLNPRVDIVSGVSDTEFVVDAGDIDKFFIGSIVRVHDDDYTNDSNDEDDNILITEIDGNNITVDKSLGFTPDSSMVVDDIGFRDQGLPYRYV